MADKLERKQPDWTCGSEAGDAYCRHLADSVLAPHLGDDVADLTPDLHRALAEVLTNTENRIKAILTRCVQSGEATAAEPAKLLAEFRSRLHYTEDYLATCFQSRHVNYLYSQAEIDEPAHGGPRWRLVHRVLEKYKPQLHSDLLVTSSSLLDGLVSCRLVSSSEEESIIARPTPRAQAEELIRAVTPKLDESRLKQEFLPLLKKDHPHLAQGLELMLEEEEETSGPETKCCVCHFYEVVEVKRLARQLSGIVSPALYSDLSNPSLPNTTKLQLLQERVAPDQIIQSLRETYPGVYSHFCEERVTSLTCCCLRVRGVQSATSDIVDLQPTDSLTDDGDVACLSDLQSILGGVDLREQAYHLGRETRGLCLIVNNMHFSKGSQLPQRMGSEVDVKNLTSFFQELGFSIECFQDVTASGLKQVLQEVSLRDHSSYDCFVCCILSHGDSEGVLCIDNKFVPVRSIVGHFHATRCVSLAGKPKLFFVQASRGQVLSGAVVSVKPEGETCVDEADIFVGFPSTPEHFSFRNQTEGSWYINALIEALSKYGEQFDFQTCMTMVTQLVNLRVPNTRVPMTRLPCQTPESISTLRKPLFLSQSPILTTPAPKFRLQTNSATM